MQEYEIYENGQLIEATAFPNWQLYDERMKSFYCCAEKDARAILIDREEEESFYANIKGREGYAWLERTVEIRRV